METLIISVFPLQSYSTMKFLRSFTECYSRLVTCSQFCPCQDQGLSVTSYRNKKFGFFMFILDQDLCLNGCDNCANSICECKDYATSVNYLKCEESVESEFKSCAESCSETGFLFLYKRCLKSPNPESNNISCLSVCNRDFNENLKKCPCMEGISIQ